VIFDEQQNIEKKVSEQPFGFGRKKSVSVTKYTEDTT
jgi:hypothetical protein